MTAALLFMLMSALAIPAPQAPVAPDRNLDFLTEKERADLRRQSNVDGRIRVYLSASERYQSTVPKLVTGQEFDTLSGTMAKWEALLVSSLADIESGVAPGKKPKNLRRFEIHLRKAIGEVQSLRKSGSVEAFDALEGWCSRAETIRGTIVKIMFAK